MPYFIDRRLNPKDKSLGNRQRFMRRARAEIKDAISRSIKDRSLADAASGDTISIPTKGIGEPRLRHDQSRGRRERAFSGNKEFLSGDRIPKPRKGGAGGAGSEGANDGEGEDAFRFALSRDEFLDLFFEDLELPDLTKTGLKEVLSYTQRHAGFATSGAPNSISIVRTMRNSFGRRMALRRPRPAEVEEVSRRIEEIEADPDPGPEERARLKALCAELEALDRRRRTVPYLDPLDIRYRQYQPHPEPNTDAVMFCLMDVSGSMGEREKDLAKRFFVLLHLFLQRRYDRIEVVFVRHTHKAQEVDEETFFHSRDTGGTVVSTALHEMLKIVRDRYPTNDWNIYAAQASDGENYSGDSETCTALLHQELMPLCQYYAYVEILDEREMEIFNDPEHGAQLWQAYREVSDAWPNFEMKRIARAGDIYPVFRELFAKQRGHG